MLTENDVIDAVCDYLLLHQYEILLRCATNEKGVDIIARQRNGSGRILIEAKGETSARSGSGRFGKPFDSAQVRDHVANAFYTAARLFGEFHGHGDSVAMAFPDTPLHRKYLEPLESVTGMLKIGVFLVETDHSVRLSALTT